MEPMFDQDSFLDEIQTKFDARNSVDYLALNEHQFMEELRSAGKSYDEREKALAQVWTNLVNSCKRVGYTDSLVESKAKRFSIK